MGRDTLTGAASNNALPPLFLAQTRHKIIRSPNLKTEHLLQILAFQIYLVAEFGAEVCGED